MNKQIKIFWGIVIAAIIIIIIALSRTPRVDMPVAKTIPQGPITIGVIAPFTGEDAAFGMPIRNAAELAVEEINAKGGIAGHELEVVWEDGQCDEKTATAAAQKLINLDQVDIIFGGICPAELLAIAPLAETAKVLVISPTVTVSEVSGAGDFTFRTAPSDINAATAAANYAYDEMEAHKAAIISETKSQAQGLRQAFKDGFTALGGEIIADETYDTGATDLTEQITKIKESGPDLIYIIPQTFVPGITILKQLAENDIQAKLLTTEVLVNRSVIIGNAEDMEGLMGITQWLDNNNEQTNKMFEKYQEKFNEEPLLPMFQANMYSQFYLIKEAINKVGLDAEKLRDYLYGLKGWKHALGTLTFDQNGDPIGLSYSIKKVENGELVEVEIFKSKP